MLEVAGRLRDMYPAAPPPSPILRLAGDTIIIAPPARTGGSHGGTVGAVRRMAHASTGAHRHRLGALQLTADKSLGYDLPDVLCRVDALLPIDSGAVVPGDHHGGPGQHWLCQTQLDAWKGQSADTRRVSAIRSARGGPLDGRGDALLLDSADGQCGARVLRHARGDPARGREVSP